MCLLLHIDIYFVLYREKGTLKHMGKTKPLQIFILGGGQGQGRMIELLRKECERIGFAVNITACIHGMDNGGHSGILRKELRIPAVGDGRNVIAALASKSIMRDNNKRTMINYRFKSQGGSGHIDNVSLGNCNLAGLTLTTGSLAMALNEFSRQYRTVGQVLPVSLDDADIHFSYGGSDAFGENKADKIGAKDPPIDSVFLVPCPWDNTRPWQTPQLYDQTRRAILASDVIITSPGSLMSINPHFLIGGFCDTVCEAMTRGARLIVICNIMSRRTESKFMKSTAMHVEHICATLNGISCVDSVFVNTRPVPRAILKKYAEEDDAYPVIDENTKHARETIAGPFVTLVGGIVKHNRRFAKELVRHLVSPREQRPLCIFDCDSTIRDTHGTGKPYAEAAKILNRIAPTYTLVMLTAGNEEKQKAKLTEFPSVFRETVIVPNAADKRQALETLARKKHLCPIDLKKCYVIGDDVNHEIRFGREQGMNTIHVNRNGKIHSQQVADHTISSLDELPAILSL